MEIGTHEVNLDLGVIVAIYLGRLAHESLKDAEEAQKTGFTLISEFNHHILFKINLI
jgi:hypothetical protein